MGQRSGGLLDSSFWGVLSSSGREPTSSGQLPAPGRWGFSACLGHLAPWGPMCPFPPSSPGLPLSPARCASPSLPSPRCLPMFRSVWASCSGTPGFPRPPCPDASLPAHVSPGMGASEGRAVGALSTVAPPRPERCLAWRPSENTGRPGGGAGQLGLAGSRPNRAGPGSRSCALSEFLKPTGQGSPGLRVPFHPGRVAHQEGVEQAHTQADNQQTFAFATAHSSLATVKILRKLGCDCCELLQKIAGSASGSKIDVSNAAVAF